MITQEKKIWSTPNGGDSSVIYFQDKDGNPTDKEHAVKAEIVEYKGKKEIYHTYGKINNGDARRDDRY